MRVLLHGCNGKMGQVMTRTLAGLPDMKIVCGVDMEPDKVRNCYPVYASLKAVEESPDIVIDFSHRTCLDALLEFGQARHVPLVICTTGFNDEERQRMADVSRNVPILNSGNMSLGVNLILSLVRQAAVVLQDGFDVEIVEKHHNQKVDAPSGTALMIADAVRSALDHSMEYVYERHSKTGKRQRNEIGIHSVRGGAIVGEHSVTFAGRGEVVEISHSALSRDVFAHGAIKAAEFLLAKGPGLYSMRDVIEDQA